MELKNNELAQMIQKFGESNTLDLLKKKIADDEARKEYHKKYNAKKNAVLRMVKLNHPELFKVQ